MEIRKIGFSVARAFLLLVILTAACQPSAPALAPTAKPQAQPATPVSNSGEKIKLQFWRYIEENKEEKALIQEYAKKYSDENPNVQVEVSFIPWDQYGGDKLISGIASGQGPDVFWLSPPDMIPFVDNDVLLPLETYLPDTTRKDFSEESLRNVTYNGHLYAIPNEQELAALFYNKDLFDKEGLQPPKTWDEMLADAKKLTTPDRYGFEVETSPGGYQLYTFWPFLWQAGGQVLNSDWTKSELNSPNSVKAFQLWEELFKQKLTPPTHVDPAWYVDNLALGKVAMGLNGSWAVSMLKSQYPDFKYGVAPLPIPDGGKPASVGGGWVTVVNSKSQHKEEAVKFALWLEANPDPTFGYNWSFVANFKWPVRKSVMDKAKAMLDTWPYNVFRDQVQPSVTSEPSFPADVKQAIVDALQSISYQNVPAAEAAKVASDKIDAFMADYKGSKSPSH